LNSISVSESKDDIYQRNRIIILKRVSIEIRIDSYSLELICLSVIERKF